MSGELSAAERQVLDWLASQEDAMQALLAQLVNIDSNSYDKAGVDEAGRAIRAFLDRHGVA
jgi:glutamate carboxypeptidase